MSQIDRLFLFGTCFSNHGKTGDKSQKTKNFFFLLCDDGKDPHELISEVLHGDRST